MISRLTLPHLGEAQAMQVLQSGEPHLTPYGVWGVALQGTSQEIRWGKFGAVDRFGRWTVLGRAENSIDSILAGHTYQEASNV